jgi:lipid A 4'-phosphatase
LTWALAAVLGLGAAFAALFLAYPELDLMVARVCFGTDGRWFLQDHPAAGAINEGIEILLWVTAALLVVLFIVIWLRRRPLLGLDRRAIVYVFLCFLIGPGLVTNTLFKDHWGRARPSQLVEFGGERAFSPALVISDQCPKNCSFVSGDASAAFGYLSFALLARRRRPHAIGAALGFGAGVGAVRMMQGAHFLSDVAYAGVFTALVVLALYWLLFGPAGRRLEAVLARHLPRLRSRPARGASP